MNFSFGSKEYIECLKCLGCTPRKQIASSHQKYSLPSHLKIKGQRDFIIVIQGKKTYDPNTSSKIIKQLVRYGFKEKEILQCFKRKR